MSGKFEKRFHDKKLKIINYCVFFLVVYFQLTKGLLDEKKTGRLPKKKLLINLSRIFFS